MPLLLCYHGLCITRRILLRIWHALSHGRRGRLLTLFGGVGLWSPRTSIIFIIDLPTCHRFDTTVSKISSPGLLAPKIFYIPIMLVPHPYICSSNPCKTLQISVKLLVYEILIILISLYKLTYLISVMPHYSIIRPSSILRF